MRKDRLSISRRSPGLETFRNSLTRSPGLAGPRDEEPVGLIAALVFDRVQFGRSGQALLSWPADPWRSAAPTPVPSRSPSGGRIRLWAFLGAGASFCSSQRRIVPFQGMPRPRSSSGSTRRHCQKIAVVGDSHHGAGSARNSSSHSTDSRRPDGWWARRAAACPGAAAAAGTAQRGASPTARQGGRLNLPGAAGAGRQPPAPTAVPWWASPAARWLPGVPASRPRLRNQRRIGIGLIDLGSSSACAVKISPRFPRRSRVRFSGSRRGSCSR